MPDRDKLFIVAREWVSKAENDFRNAVHTLKLGKNCPTDTVCFHAQQCVEKYLKAILVLENIDFPKTHDIEKIFSLLPPQTRPRFAADEQILLTEYAIVARYPGWDTITLREARRAVSIARRIRKEARSIFPENVLRR